MINANTSVEEALKVGEKKCNGCIHCCSFGSAYVLKEEIPELAKNLKISEDKLINEYLEPFELFNTKHFRFKQLRKDLPYGKCIFLEKKGCKIHNIRPLHCRIATCDENGEEINNWFRIKFFLNLEDKESVRQYKEYLQFGKTIPGVKL